jgi:hypothetical protein
MKSLYESILRSTNSGKAELVKKWCNEHFWQSPNDTPSYDIDSQGRVVNYGKKNLALDTITERIPDYIRFGEITQNVFFGQSLKYMTQEQMPPKIDGVAYIDGQIETIPSCKINVAHGVCINSYPQKLKHIEPIEITCYTEKSRGPILFFDNTGIELEDVRNIHVIGDIYSLNIKKTPAAETLKKEIKKLDKQSKDKGRDLTKPYCDELFKNFPGLRFIYLSERTILEHNPRTDLWYLI